MATLPYMQFQVAEYIADTTHLTTEEHGAYLLLLMNCWQREKPIPKNRLASVCRLSNECWTHVEQVLNEFFILNEDGSWWHKRVEKDIQKIKYRKKIKNNNVQLNKTKNQHAYQAYLKTDVWQILRKQRLVVDNNKCVICGKEAKHVHHKRYKQWGSETVDDLVSLCINCHKKIHIDK